MNYLYNGIELPALPEWDKAAYPYAVIMRYSFNSNRYYKLWLSPLPLVSDILTFDCPGFRVPDDGKTYEYMFLKCEIDGTEWVTGATYTETYDTGDTNTVTFDPNFGTTFWTNKDIYSEDDGSLFLAASCPINAETGEEYHGWCLHPTTDPIDKASFLQGWLVGRRLAGMRK